MKIKLCFLLYTILIISNILAIDNNLEDMLVQIKNEILNYESIRMSEWKEPDERYIFNELLIIGEHTIIDNNTELKCYNRNKLNGEWNDIIIQLSPIKKENNTYLNIDNLLYYYQTMINVLGEPTIEIDYGFLKKSNYRQDIISQWIVNNYIIEFRTMDFGTLIYQKAEIWLAFIRISKKGYLLDAIPLVGVRLVNNAGRIKNGIIWEDVDQNTLRGFKNMAFILDYNNNSYLNMDYCIIGELEKVSQSLVTIASFDKNKILSLRIEINRFTGDYVIRYYDKNNGSEIMQLIGVAEKIDLLHSIF